MKYSKKTIDKIKKYLETKLKNDPKRSDTKNKGNSDKPRSN